MMKIDPGPTGHANIQVTLEGEDSIVLFGGANRTITKSHIDEVLKTHSPANFYCSKTRLALLTISSTKPEIKKCALCLVRGPLAKTLMHCPAISY
jgi:ribokinase